MKFPLVCTDAQTQILRDLHGRDRRERVDGTRGSLSVKALAPSVAQLLYLLIVAKRARTIIEFGTSHGYSTIHLAAAAEHTDGHVFTVDVLPQKTAFAADNLKAAGLSHRVTLVTSDGSDFVQGLPEAIDFVLVDYGIAVFEPTFRSLRNRLAPGCLIFVDGGPEGYWESEGTSRFRERLQDDSSFRVAILPMHKDQLVAVCLE